MCSTCLDGTVQIMANHGTFVLLLLSGSEVHTLPFDPGRLRCHAHLSGAPRHGIPLLLLVLMLLTCQLDMQADALL